MGTPAFRIFAVRSGGNLTLNVVTVRGGSLNNGGETGTEFISGGGLTVDAGGKLTLNHSVVTENRAEVFGGPVCCGSSAGGGIYNLGIVTLNYSLVNKNAASSGSETGNAMAAASSVVVRSRCSAVPSPTTLPLEAALITAPLGVAASFQRAGSSCATVLCRITP